MTFITFFLVSKLNVAEQRKMLLHQERYLSAMLHEYGKQDCRSASTPQVTGSTLVPNSSDAIDKQKYQAIIGSLAYVD